MCFSCIYLLLFLHALIFCRPFSLPLGVGVWLRLLVVALPGLFCTSEMGSSDVKRVVPLWHTLCTCETRLTHVKRQGCESTAYLKFAKLQHVSLAFDAGLLQGHWWGFISRNYIVWPTFLLMNVFIALKGSHFWFLLYPSEMGVAPVKQIVHLWNWSCTCLHHGNGPCSCEMGHVPVTWVMHLGNVLYTCSRVRHLWMGKCTCEMGRLFVIQVMHIWNGSCTIYTGRAPVKQL